MTQPGSAGYGAPMDPITKLVRDIEDLKRTVAAMQSLLVNQGTSQVNDPTSGNRIFYVGPDTMLDGSGRVMSVVYGARQDGTLALAIYDGGLTFGHALNETLSTFDHSGNTLYADDIISGQGLARPYLPLGTFVDATAPTATTTSSSFITLQTLAGFKQHPKVTGQILVKADSGTTGTIQVIDQDSNVIFTTNLTSGQFGYVTFGPVAIAGDHMLPISLNIQGKVLTGAGSVGARGTFATGVQS